MNNTTIGMLMFALAAALAWYQNKSKPAVQVLPEVIPPVAVPTSDVPAVITPVIPAQGNPIASRVEAVWYAEQLITWLESTDNKAGAEAVRTAITSFYLPKA